MFLESAIHDTRRLMFRLVAPGHYRRYQSRRTGAHGTKRSSYDSFDQTRSIFVHIPKTGGVSVAVTLYGNRAGSHTTVSGYQLVFGAADFQNYFKFAFVRNPWDRLYSAYRFLSTGGMNDLDRAWAEKHLTGVKDFEAFVLNVLPRPGVRDEVHLRPQFLFVRNAITRKTGVDFVGRFERIEEDFATVARRLGKDVELPRINRSRVEGDYREAYSAAMRAAVERVYAADIKAFGYRF